MCFFCRLAKQHKFQSFAVKNAVSFQKCRFDVFTEVAKLAVGKSRRLVGESRRLVGKSRRFKTLTYHRKHVNAKSASVQNSWRLLEKAVLIEKAEKMHTYEDPGILHLQNPTVYFASAASSPVCFLQKKVVRQFRRPFLRVCN